MNLPSALLFLATLIGVGARIAAAGRESAVWRATTMSGPYGIVGVVVALILIFVLLRLLGVI